MLAIKTAPTSDQNLLPNQHFLITVKEPCRLCSKLLKWRDCYKRTCIIASAKESIFGFYLNIVDLRISLPYLSPQLKGPFELVWLFKVKNLQNAVALQTASHCPAVFTGKESSTKILFSSPQEDFCQVPFIVGGWGKYGHPESASENRNIFRTLRSRKKG